MTLPGTPITAIPFTITAPGNYYLTGNLTMASSGTGIYIIANRVTLDLNGFSLDGAGTGTDGIEVLSESVTMRNGSVIGWQSFGIKMAATSSGVIEGIHADHNGTGISANRATVSNCSASSNAIGLSVTFSTIRNCLAALNQIGFEAIASSLTGCATSGNTQIGVHAQSALVESCTSSSDQVGLKTDSGATVRGNTVRGSYADGIVTAFSGGGSTVADNVVSYCVGARISVLGVGDRISHNNVSFNTGPGIYVEGTDSTIDENSAHDNNSVGIDVVAGTKNTIVLNSATNNVFNGGVLNYLILGAQNAAPITSAAAATNPWSNTQ